LFGLAYFISPVDIIPDLLLPFVGWIDDGIIIGTIVYLIRYGRLPNFWFKKKGGTHKGFSDNTTKKFDSNTQKGRAGNSANGSSGFAQNPPKTPYEILGVEPFASKGQIQAAYKEAIKKYHPDKLSHLGEEFSNLANEKFLEIQNAYDTLMNE
jgi:hypothetical protein